MTPNASSTAGKIEHMCTYVRTYVRTYVVSCEGALSDTEHIHLTAQNTDVAEVKVLNKVEVLAYYGAKTWPRRIRIVGEVLHL